MGSLRSAPKRVRVIEQPSLPIFLFLRFSNVAISLTVVKEVESHQISYKKEKHEKR